VRLATYFSTAETRVNTAQVLSAQALSLGDSDSESQIGKTAVALLTSKSNRVSQCTGYRFDFYVD
jgi:hypothetical protein